MRSLSRAVNVRRVIYWFIAITLCVLLYNAAHDELFLTKVNQLSVEVERRIQWWDWKDTSEEVFCRAAHDNSTASPIPNVVHFVHLAPEGEEAELSYYHFLSIKAAILRMNATEIKLHTYNLNTENPWWQKLEKHVTLVSINRAEVQAPHGLSLNDLHLAHQSDILRMDILMREGGIYLDTDVYTLKPFTDLLTNPRDVVMGHEGGNRYGLCNAIIVARANSTFMAKWQDTYKTFDPNVWNEHSVRQPKKLQIQYPAFICPLSPTVFFWPTWAKVHLRYMFEPITAEEAKHLRANMTSFEGSMYANQLAYHGSSGGYLPFLTAESIAAKDTRFNVLIRDIAAAELS